ncbi:MAG: hypothetical protein QXE79_04650 [Candidatus Bathyarchaeia archaeon]
MQPKLKTPPCSRRPSPTLKPKPKLGRSSRKRSRQLAVGVEEGWREDEGDEEESRA